MKVLELKIKLETTLGYYGSKGAKPNKVKSTAASKFKQISKRHSQKEESEASSGKQNEDQKGAPKSKEALAYGSHDGNIQVHSILTLKDTSFEELAKYFDYVDNLTATLEQKTSWDIRKAKYDYLTKRDEILKRYTEKYGSNPSDTVTAQILGELKQHSFEYSKTQIVILLTTDEYFEGARLGSDGHYHMEFRTKALWKKGKALLSTEEIKAIVGVTKEERLKLTTTNVTISRYIAYNPTTGHYKLVFGTQAEDEKNSSW